MGNGSSSEKIETKDYIPILCIDGGGVRGIIPSKVLSVLESKLQDLDPENKDAKIADYFDYIAGTSTGGLMTAMLTTPNDNNRPLFPAQKIVDFYDNESPSIFSDKHMVGDNGLSLFSKEHQQQLLSTAANEMQLINVPEARSEFIKTFVKVSNSIAAILRYILSWSWIPSAIRDPIRKRLLYPKYDGRNLHQTINKNLGGKLLSQTLTNVIIPTFDIKLFKPTIFSTLKAKSDNPEKSMDAQISDACIGTSAAPCYFPPYKFKTSKDIFNLVDGGVAANNPSLLAVCDVMKERKTDCRKLVVLSLGTGAPDESGRLEVGDGVWGPLDWLLQDDGSNPLIDILLTAPDEMTAFYMHKIFEFCGIEDNYIRIQAKMKLQDAKMDDATDANRKHLHKIGQELADTYNDKLEALAKLLVDIRKARL